MDPRITAQLVTLDPAKEGEQELCQLVIHETGVYLYREPLCPLKDSVGDLITGEWVQHHCNHAMDCISLQIEHLKRQFTGSSAPVPISRAWQDWQARHEALQPLRQCADPAYVAALDELLGDLHGSKPQHLEETGTEDHYVSLLVSLSSFGATELALLTKVLGWQLSRTPMVMYMRMVRHSPLARPQN
jgi:hypothetical protein